MSAVGWWMLADGLLSLALLALLLYLTVTLAGRRSSGTERGDASS